MASFFRNPGAENFPVILFFTTTGLQWAQAQVMAHPYLHAPLDPRCSPVTYLGILLGEPVGCLLFGRPQATRVMGWYESLEDVHAGR